MALDRQQAMRRCVLVAQEQIRDGAEERLPGDPIPSARAWGRGFVDVTRGRLLALSPEACAAIVREALKADPSLVEALRPAGDQRQRR